MQRAADTHQTESNRHHLVSATVSDIILAFYAPDYARRQRWQHIERACNAGLHGRSRAIGRCHGQRGHVAPGAPRARRAGNRRPPAAAQSRAPAAPLCPRRGRACRPSQLHACHSQVVDFRQKSVVFAVHGEFWSDAVTLHRPHSNDVMSAINHGLQASSMILKASDKIGLPLVWRSWSGGHAVTGTGSTRLHGQASGTSNTVL